MSSEQHYTTATAATLYAKREQTIRNWVNEFKDYLSPTAQPGRGKNLLFTLDDMQVLSLASNLRQIGTSYAEIHIALQNGERGSMPDAEPKELAKQTHQEMNKQLALHIQVLRGQLEEAQQEAARAKELELEVARLQAQVEILGRVDVPELYKEIGRLSGELDALRRQIDKDAE